MEDFENIYKKLNFGVKRSAQNLNQIVSDHGELLRLRILPDDDDEDKQVEIIQPASKKHCDRVENDEEQNNEEDVEILAGAKLSFTANNNRRRRKHMNKLKLQEGNNGSCNDEAVKFEKIQRIRKLNRIFTWGNDIPEPLIEFSDLVDMPTQFSINLIKENITIPSPIQMQSIPIMLKNRDLLASAPTGSGKTLAFIIPLIIPIMKHRNSSFDTNTTTKKTIKNRVLSAIILEPTKVLAKQTFHHFEKFCYGLPIKCDYLKDEISIDADIIVTTPNKLIFELDKLDGIEKTKFLANLNWLVVDESDRIFDNTEEDQSFRKQLTKIIGYCNGKNTRRAFFSATFSYEVEEWCQENLSNVAMVCIGPRNSANSAVKQELIFAGWEGAKISAIKTLLQTNFDPPALVFVQSKDRAKQVYKELKSTFKKLSIEMISGEIPEKTCDSIIEKFRQNQISLLISTEILGRGLDLSNMNMVINFDLPTSIVSYIHRIGRCGRAGRFGRAITYFTEMDLAIIKPIAMVIHQSGFQVPDYLLKLSKLPKSLKKQIQKKAPKRKNIVRNWKNEKFKKRNNNESVVEKANSNNNNNSSKEENVNINNNNEATTIVSLKISQKRRKKSYHKKSIKKSKKLIV